MKTVVARLFEVTCQFDWQVRDDDTSVWHCATLSGAHDFIENQREISKLIWYSIEGQEYIPCDENNPDGQLYIGVTHFEYHDLRKET